jgi:hypothetical protein
MRWNRRISSTPGGIQADKMKLNAVPSKKDERQRIK